MVFIQLSSWLAIAWCQWCVVTSDIAIAYLDLSNSVFSKAHFFLNGVSKLKRNKCHELTTREKEEIKNLRTPSPVRVAVEAVESERNLRTSLKKRKAEEPETYIDCDFILATADVERLWSLAKNLLTDKRRRMTTVMIHVILFLKENRNLWNDNMVYQSIYNCHRNATNLRRHEKKEQFFEQRSMMQATTEAIELPHDNL